MLRLLHATPAADQGTRSADCTSFVIDIASLRATNRARGAAGIVGVLDRFYIKPSLRQGIGELLLPPRIAFVPRLGYYNSGLFYWLIEYFKYRGMELYVPPALRPAAATNVLSLGFRDANGFRILGLGGGCGFEVFIYPTGTSRQKLVLHPALRP